MYPDEFEPGHRPCYYCPLLGKRPATQRISVNVWGTIVERDVCNDHAGRDGSRVDD